MSERQRLLARLWSLLTLLFLVAAQRLLALIVGIVRRQEAPAVPRLHQVRIDVAAGVSAEQIGAKVGTAAWLLERGVQPAHPLSPVGRLRGAVDVTVDGDGLGTLPSDELHQHTLALLAEHAHRARQRA